MAEPSAGSLDTGSGPLDRSTASARRSQRVQNSRKEPYSGPMDASEQLRCHLYAPVSTPYVSDLVTENDADTFFRPLSGSCGQNHPRSKHAPGHEQRGMRALQQQNRTSQSASRRMRSVSSGQTPLVIRSERDASHPSRARPMKSINRFNAMPANHAVPSARYQITLGAVSTSP